MSPTTTRRQVLAGLAATGVASCAKDPANRFDAEVIVIGAGLAGLNAARILSAQGKDVLLLEASARIGGRLYTLDAGDRGLSEGGGEQVGASYARVRSTAAELGVPIVDDSGAVPATMLHVQDQSLSETEWAASAMNPRPADYKAIRPGSLLGRLAFAENPLKDIYSWHQDPAIDISADDWLRDRGLDERSLRLADHTLNANDLRSYSMVNLYRTLALFSHDRQLGASGSIEGGAQRLPEAMASALPRAVALKQRVSHISVLADSVEIGTTTGGLFRAAYAIAAIPFPVLARLTVDAPFSKEQTQAIADLPYTQIVQLHFSCDIPFWEQDGLPPSIWTDGPLERIFAQTDEHLKPTGLFRAWINGRGATRLNARSDDELQVLCRDEMKRLRPASKGEVEVFSVLRWTADNPLAGGAYMHWAPGQVSSWFHVMGRPAGRLYFAGEHLSQIHTGLEGAMESGERTALELLGL